MKVLGPVRAALGVRTVFNILGPLTNPAEPPFHVIGAYNEATARLMAQALAGMPIKRAFVVHGAGGWDEPTPLGPFLLLDVRGSKDGVGEVRESRRSPAEYGMQLCDEASLQGADASHNAAALTRVLRGEERGAHRDALVLGAALALEVAGRAATPAAAAAMAAAAIDDGRASALLAKLAAFSRSIAAGSQHEQRLPRHHGRQQPRARRSGAAGMQRGRTAALGPGDAAATATGAVAAGLRCHCRGEAALAGSGCAQER